MTRPVARFKSARFSAYLALICFSACIAAAWLAPRNGDFWIASALAAAAAVGFALRALHLPDRAAPDRRMVGRRAIVPAIVESHQPRPEPRRETRPERQAPPVILPAPARYPLLRPEDEEEIELIFQRMKSARGSDLRESRGDARGASENPRRE